MSSFQSFSNSYYSSHISDDSSTVFDADTVVPDKVPSLPPASQEESPQSFTSELLRHINSQHSLAIPSTTTITTTATAIRSEEISTNESSSSSSNKRPIANNSSHQSTKRARQSSRLKRQPDQSCVDKSGSEVEDENGHVDCEPDEAVINQSSMSQISTTKRQRQNELNWKSKFEELRAYKQLHGNTNVLQRSEVNKQLGVWVSTQRTQYKKFQENKKSPITPERIEMLNSIGFEWVSQYKAPRNESAWNERYNELKAYKEEYKDTNVPTRWEVNKELGNWVKNQRKEYKKFQEKKKSQITPERIEMLESIGFEWVSPNKGGSRNESLWNERFNELKAYKDKYGRTNVPRDFKDNKQLSNWVSKQRVQYKKFKENKKSQITPERIEMLESIGFE